GISAMKWKQPSHRGLLLPALLSLLLAAPGWAANKTPTPPAGQASLTLTNCNSELCNANNTAWTLQKTPGSGTLEFTDASSNTIFSLTPQMSLATGASITLLYTATFDRCRARRRL